MTSISQQFEKKKINLTSIWKSTPYISIMVLLVALVITLGDKYSLQTTVEIAQLRYDARITELEFKAENIQDKLNDHIREQGHVSFNETTKQ